MKVSSPEVTTIGLVMDVGCNWQLPLAGGLKKIGLRVKESRIQVSISYSRVLGMEHYFSVSLNLATR
tara:strand:+ start:643 stop:843 length:201 start_codon:yes stop_codon:yes gene_type:complete